MADVDDDRWSVRGVPKATRDAAAAAAQRGGISVGAWLRAAVDRALQAEREPIPAVGVSGLADKMSDAYAATSDALGLVERVVESAVRLAAVEGVPKRLRGHANRLLREMLPQPVSRPAPVRRIGRAVGADGAVLTNGHAER